MKTFQLLLKQKARKRYAIGNIVEKAADEFDEIAVAFERDLAGSK